MTSEEKEITLETKTTIAPNYRALYFELLEVMETMGLNMAIQAKNQKNQAKVNEQKSRAIVDDQGNGPATI